MIENIKDNEKFKKYYDILIQENNKYNLTNITDETEVYYKHFLDSLKLGEYIDLNNKSLCDVGSGAGFPGIPLKIMYKDMKLTIIEPTLKRCNFLNMLVKELELDNVIIINDRVENCKELRECYDYVTARAVSNLPMLLELCIPLVKVNGIFCPMKGSNFQEEIEASINALKELDCKVVDVKTYQLSEYGMHSVILINKIKETNKKYPRGYALIKKKPL